MTRPEPLLCPDLSAVEGLRHGFFTRLGGISTGPFASLNCGLSTGDDPGMVEENRARAAAAIGQTRRNLVLVSQVHGISVQVINSDWRPTQKFVADALVSRRRGVALGILTADCVPVLFADPVAQVIGAAHAGWRGALGNITETTLIAMEALGAKRRDIIAAIGPCIGPDSYEVGSEFVKSFLRFDEGYRRFFRDGKQPNHPMFDLPAFVAACLEESGVGRIFSGGWDTLADEARFFSHRRACLLGDEACGRQVSMIALEE